MMNLWIFITDGHHNHPSVALSGVVLQRIKSGVRASVVHPHSAALALSIGLFENPPYILCVNHYFSQSWIYLFEENLKYIDLNIYSLLKILLPL